MVKWKTVGPARKLAASQFKEDVLFTDKFRWERRFPGADPGRSDLVGRIPESRLGLSPYPWIEHHRKA